MKEYSEDQAQNSFDPGRRSFSKSALASVLSAGALLLHSEKSNEVAASTESGMKLAQSHIMSSSLDDEQLIFLKQLGVNYVEAWVSGEHVTYADIIGLRKRVEDAGLKIYSTGFLDKYNSAAIHLGLPGRDDEIKEYQDFIRNLGKAGIHNTIYAWNPAGVYSTGSTEIRGCTTRVFNLEEALKKPLAYGRVYTKEELWDNYRYFIQQMLPVAEDEGVRLALHPTDPPVSTRGIERIMCSNKDYMRAMEIAHYSKYSGILFCVGTWGEMAGPDGKGEDVIGAIHHFGKSGHIVGVHFRNVSSPVPSTQFL